MVMSALRNRRIHDRSSPEANCFPDHVGRPSSTILAAHSRRLRVNEQENDVHLLDLVLTLASNRQGDCRSKGMVVRLAPREEKAMMYSDRCSAHLLGILHYTYNSFAADIALAQAFGS